MFHGSAGVSVTGVRLLPASLLVALSVTLYRHTHVIAHCGASSDARTAVALLPRSVARLRYTTWTVWLPYPLPFYWFPFHRSAFFHLHHCACTRCYGLRRFLTAVLTFISATRLRSTRRCLFSYYLPHLDWFRSGSVTLRFCVEFTFATSTVHLQVTFTSHPLPHRTTSRFLYSYATLPHHPRTTSAYYRLHYLIPHYARTARRTYAHSIFVLPFAFTLTPTRGSFFCRSFSYGLHAPHTRLPVRYVSPHTRLRLYVHARAPFDFYISFTVPPFHALLHFRAPGSFTFRSTHTSFAYGPRVPYVGLVVLFRYLCRLRLPLRSF